MERIHALIDKLQQQKAANAPAAHLLFTVQLLQQELSQLQGRNGSFGNSKVAVRLPVSLNFSEESLRVPYSEAAKEKEVFELTGLPEEAAEEATIEEAPPVATAPKSAEYSLRKPALTEAYFETPQPAAEERKLAASQPAYYNPLMETATEAPTLAAADRRELHEVISEKRESLNDRLKEQKTEVAHLLKESPIKDLRKAIGINDRFAFIRELFRNDEAAYERSVKTINGFNIYSEAEYWMTRELKHKMGWDDANETVKHFHQLVRRRFS